MPSTLYPDISNVAAPYLVGRIDHKLAIQMVRSVDTLHRRLLVGMLARLFAHQAQLLHQAANLEATNHDAIFPHHAHDATATSRTSALGEQFVNTAAKHHTLGIGLARPF